MSESPDKKSPKRRTSFDVDLDAMLDEAELSLAPINDLLDEDAIDRLLVDDGFDIEDDGQLLDANKQEPIMDDGLTFPSVHEQDLLNADQVKSKQNPTSKPAEHLSSDPNEQILNESESLTEHEADDLLNRLIDDGADQLDQPLADEIDIRLDEASAEWITPEIEDADEEALLVDAEESTDELASETSDESLTAKAVPSQPLADEIDLRLDEASAEWITSEIEDADEKALLVDAEESTDELASETPDESLTAEAEPSQPLADEIDLRLDEASAEWITPEIEIEDVTDDALLDDDSPAFSELAADEFTEGLAEVSQDQPDALDLMLQQASDDLGLSLADDILPQSSEMPLATASSIERLADSALENQFADDQPSVITSAAAPEMTEEEPDFLSLMLDQEAELASDIEEEFEQQLQARVGQQPISEEPYENKAPFAEAELETATAEISDDTELVVDVDPQEPELQEDDEVLAFGTLADDNWHINEDAPVQNDESDNPIVSNTDRPQEEQVLADEQDESLVMEEVELDILDVPTTTDEITEQPEALVDNDESDFDLEVDLDEPLEIENDPATAADQALAEVDAEFRDDLLVEDDAESQLAKQIEADLLSDADLSADDSLEPLEAFDDNDELTALEVIQDEYVDSQMAESDFDEFADDNLFADLDIASLAGLEDEPAADETNDALISDQPADEDLGEDDFLMADFDISADPDISDIAENPYGDDSPLLDEPLANQTDSNDVASIDFDDDILVETTEKTPAIDEAALAALALAEFKAEQDSINKQQKKLITDLEQKTKKSSIFTYTALGFGVVALSVAAYLGFVAHSAKNEANRAHEVIAELEKKLAAAPKPVEAPAEADDANAESTNEEAKPAAETDVAEQGDEHAAAAEESKQTTQHGKTELTAPVSEKSLEHKPDADAHDAKEITTEKSTGKPETAKTDDKAETTTSDKNKASKDSEKSETTDQKIVVPKKKIVFTEEKAAPKPAAEKSSEPTPSKPASETLKKQPVAQTAKPVAKKKPVKTEPLAKKEPPAVRKFVPSGDWSVNLIAFKQDWYAKGKANEFRQKGIPVDIVPVQIDNVTWYRIRVNGFNGRADANAYADRVKKALNLSSVWVGK